MFTIFIFNSNIVNAQSIAGFNPIEFIEYSGYAQDNATFSYYPHKDCTHFDLDIGTQILVINEERVNGYRKTIVDDKIYWIKEKDITKEQNFSEYNIYQDNRKSYEDWRCITNTDSPHYALQQQAYTGDYGIRMIGDRYCVAVGQAFCTKIGTKIDFIVQHEDGSKSKIKCILGDCKANCDTDGTNIYGNDSSVAEFIVDTPSLPYVVYNNNGTGTGDISDCSKELKGKIINVKVYYE